MTLESRCQHESAARACLFLNCIQAPLRTRLRTFAKTGLEISGHDKVVDRILCVWFCGRKKNVRFRFSKTFHKRRPHTPTKCKKQNCIVGCALTRALLAPQSWHRRPEIVQQKSSVLVSRRRALRKICTKRYRVLLWVMCLRALQNRY